MSKQDEDWMCRPFVIDYLQKTSPFKPTPEQRESFEKVRKMVGEAVREYRARAQFSNPYPDFPVTGDENDD